MTLEKDLVIRSVLILDSSRNATQCVYEDVDYIIRISVDAIKPIENASVGYNIKTRDGITLCGASTALEGKFHSFSAGESRNFDFTFKSILAIGTYYLSAGVAETLTPNDEIHNYIMRDFIHDAVTFVAVARNKFDGMVNLHSELISMSVIVP